jgi:pyruvate dehydrogenase E1 component alpha subunit
MIDDFLVDTGKAGKCAGFFLSLPFIYRPRNFGKLLIEIFTFRSSVLFFILHYLCDLKIKKLAKKFSKETYLYWYELMLLLRRFEEKAGQMYGMQKIRGFCHLYIGQEAIAAGCMTATIPEDIFITAYRDHALAIAKGVSAKSCMAELYAKATGCSKGKGGSMHMFGVKERFFGGHGIVGAQIGTGAGLAFAEKYKGTKNAVLCFFGDGAARQGILHETFNMAMLWKLPVVFICENNNYAMGTSVARTSNVLDIYKLADAYDMPGDRVDGMNPEAVHDAVERAVKRARENGGPTLLEVKTYRYKGHSMSDPAKYRTKEEMEEYKQKDPVETSLAKLKNDFGVSDQEIEIINDRVKAEIDEAVKFADESPFPDDSQMYKDIYAEEDYPFIMD